MPFPLQIQRFIAKKDKEKPLQMLFPSSKEEKHSASTQATGLISREGERTTEMKKKSSFLEKMQRNFNENHPVFVRFFH